MTESAGIPIPILGSVANVLAEHRRLGRNPGLCPQSFCRAPLWFEPQFASRHIQVKRIWHDWDSQGSGRLQRWELHQVNNLQRAEDGTIGASGLLRYLDLDVAIALSMYWAQSGNGSIEIELCELLRAMGYETLDNAPYQELRHGLTRLKHVDIALIRSGTNRALTLPWNILSEVRVKEHHGIGQPSTINVQLSHAWEEALSQGLWQSIDLNTYILLAHRDRSNGLARVLYLYLSSWRTNNNQVRIPLSGLAERFAQRRSDGSYRFRDPIGDTRSVLYRGLQHLVVNGVFSIDRDINGVELDKGWMEGTIHFVPSPIAPKPKQLVFLQRSLLGNPNTYNLCLEKNSQTAALPTSSATADPWVVFEQEKTAYFNETIPLLIDELTGRETLQCIESARAAGWRSEELWGLLGSVLWRNKVNKTIAKPTGYIAKILNHKAQDDMYRAQFVLTKSDEAMSAPFRAVKDWLFNGPLKDIKRPIRPTAPKETL